MHQAYSTIFPSLLEEFRILTRTLGHQETSYIQDLRYYMIKLVIQKCNHDTKKNQFTF